MLIKRSMAVKAMIRGDWCWPMFSLRDITTYLRLRWTPSLAVNQLPTYTVILKFAYLSLRVSVFLSGNVGVPVGISDTYSGGNVGAVQVRAEKNGDRSASCDILAMVGCGSRLCQVLID